MIADNGVDYPLFFAAHGTICESDKCFELIRRDYIMWERSALSMG